MNPTRLPDEAPPVTTDLDPPADPPTDTSSTPTTPAITRPAAGGVGLLAVGVALGVGDLVAGLVAPPSSPVLAVGDQAIRLTPEWLKETAIAWFGTYDKVALLGGMVVVILAVTVVAGLASRRDARPGLVLDRKSVV